MGFDVDAVCYTVYENNICLHVAVLTHPNNTSEFTVFKRSIKLRKYTIVEFFVGIPLLYVINGNTVEYNTVILEFLAVSNAEPQNVRVVAVSSIIADIVCAPFTFISDTNAGTYLYMTNTYNNQHKHTMKTYNRHQKSKC